MRRSAAIACSAVVACLLTTGLAALPSAAASAASIQATLTSDGNGTLLVNENNGTAATWTWQTCASDGTHCAPFTSGLMPSSPNGQVINTVGAPSAVVFVATASDGSTATSPIWQGNAFATAKPAVHGNIRVNALVQPTPATWTGGWNGDFDRTQLAACVTASGTECITLTNPAFSGGCAGGAAVIAPVFVGQYLRVADRIYGVSTVFPLDAADSPYGPQAWPASPTTSVAVVGRIAPATGPPAAGCAVAPTVTVTARGVGRISSLSGPFTATLRATCGGRHERVTHSFGAGGPPPHTLRLSHRQLRRLGRGTATFEITIDGIPRIYRLVRLR